MTNALSHFPGDDGFYSLAPTTATVAFVVAASPKAVNSSDVARSLERISGELARLPRGQTLWYDQTAGAWTTSTGEHASSETATALEEVCEKIRAIFGGSSVALSGAATSCAE